MGSKAKKKTKKKKPTMTRKTAAALPKAGVYSKQLTAQQLDVLWRLANDGWLEVSHNRKFIHVVMGKNDTGMIVHGTVFDNLTHLQLIEKRKGNATHQVWKISAEGLALLRLDGISYLRQREISS